MKLSKLFVGALLALFGIQCEAAGVVEIENQTRKPVTPVTVLVMAVYPNAPDTAVNNCSMTYQNVGGGRYLPVLYFCYYAQQLLLHFITQ